MKFLWSKLSLGQLYTDGNTNTNDANTNTDDNDTWWTKQWAKKAWNNQGKGSNWDLISEISRKKYAANLANDVHCNFPPEALMNTTSSYEAAYWLQRISYNFLIWIWTLLENVLLVRVHIKIALTCFELCFKLCFNVSLTGVCSLFSSKQQLQTNSLFRQNLQTKIHIETPQKHQTTT